MSVSGARIEEMYMREKDICWLFSSQSSNEHVESGNPVYLFVCLFVIRSHRKPRAQIDNKLKDVILVTMEKTEKCKRRHK